MCGWQGSTQTRAPYLLPCRPQLLRDLAPALPPAQSTDPAEAAACSPVSHPGLGTQQALHKHQLVMAVGVKLRPVASCPCSITGAWGLGQNRFQNLLCEEGPQGSSLPGCRGGYSCCLLENGMRVRGEFSTTDRAWPRLPLCQFLGLQGPGGSVRGLRIQPSQHSRSKFRGGPWSCCPRDSADSTQGGAYDRHPLALCYRL